MKKPAMILGIPFITLFSMSLMFMNGVIPEKGDYDYLSQRLENTRAYTLEVLEAMPADQYDFKPTEEVRTYAAQAFHIAYSAEFYYKSFKGERPEWAPGDENRMNKEELIAYTSEQFDAMNKLIKDAEAKPELTEGLLGFLDHNAHHRGQMITYLRVSGIEPPQYR